MQHCLQSLLNPLRGLQPVGVDAARLAGYAARLGQPVVDAAVLGAEGAGEEVDLLLGIKFRADEIVGAAGAGGVVALEMPDEGAPVQPTAGVEVSEVDDDDGTLVDFTESEAEKFTVSSQRYSGWVLL